MATPNLLRRLEFLEQRVMVLETLPAKIDALADQIVQLRGEMRSEFSALRAEVRASDDETRREMRALNEETKQLARDLNAETRTHMLVLHEDLVERIKRIGEGSAPPAAGPATWPGAVPPRRPRRRPPRG
jgi:DNA repair ATPase RecN